ESMVHRWSRVWISLCAVLAGSALTAFYARASEPQSAAVKLGGKVTPFELKDSDAKPARLSDALKGAKAVVIDFWSARCPVSEKYEPVLKKLAADYASKGVVFLAIDANFNEPADEVQKVQKARGVPYRVLMDGAEGKLAAYFGASHTPEAYLLTPQGVL